MPVTKLLKITEPSDVLISIPDPVINTVITPVTPPPINKPPIANAGPDQSLVIPATATTINSVLNGSASTDPEGTTLTYGWRKISGPTAGTIAMPATSITSVNGLVAGTYVFELEVTDNLSATATDVVTVTVTDGVPYVRPRRNVRGLKINRN